MGPTGDVNVIQIHPTRRCNLRCQHCYSTSGPEHSGELKLETLERFLHEAAAEGFNAIGVSGGEPLTYRPLPKLLQAARGLGYYTTVTSNALMLDARRLEALAPALSLLAISVDGVPESHDRMRGLPGAFDKLRGKLPLVRKANIPFGFIFTLTLGNLHELGAVAEFAVSEGARLLQIHPLEQAGRARVYELLPPDDLELAYAFIEVARLQEHYRGQITLQLDVADRTLIEREPWRAFAIPTPEPNAVAHAPLASLVSPLVVQDDGWVVPIQHGFSSRHAIAHLDCGPFAEQAAAWKRVHYPAFLDLSRRVWQHLRSGPEHLPFTNWYAAITRASDVSSIAWSPPRTRTPTVAGSLSGSSPRSGAAAPSPACDA